MTGMPLKPRCRLPDTPGCIVRPAPGLLLVAWLSFTAVWVQAAAEPALMLVGGQFEYTVQSGDFLTSIGARYGVEPLALARLNGLDSRAILRPGQVLQVDNRHIVPAALGEGMLINAPQRMLYFFQGERLAAQYPVGLGRPSWPTPLGHFTVANLQQDKVWYVPKSIQEEMRQEGKVVQTVVPPGPDNPLGKYWIGLSSRLYGIHGTIAPMSVYHFQSHGCIRLHPDDIVALFPRVREGLPIRIIYAPVLLTRLPDGRIFLEVHGDIYKKGIDPIKVVQTLAQTQGLIDMLDWDQVLEVIRLQEGVAREVQST